MLRNMGLICLCLITSCSAPQHKDFVTKPIEEQEEIIRSLNVDQQIPLYLASMSYRQPRPVSLAGEIAAGGRPTARFVAAAITKADNIQDRVNLLMILLSMKQMNIYDSCNDPAIFNNIYPEEYSPRESEAKLIYTLDFVELCLGPRRSLHVSAEGASERNILKQ